MTRSLRFSLVLVLAPTGCEQVKKLDVDPQAGLPCEVQRIFTESCAIAGCHDGSTQKPDLRAEASPTSIESQADQAASPYVVVGNPAGSYMASKLVQEVPDGWIPRTMDLMPPAGVPLAASDRALLLGWIAGAELEACGGATGGDDGGPTSTGGGDDDVAGETTTGAAEPLSCATADVVTEGEKTIDAGVGAGQIPTDIAEVLDSNCGCHYGTMTNVFIPYAGLLDMTTLAGFEAESVMPTNMPATDLIQSRLDHENAALHMPPITFCRTEDGDAMPPADYDLLKAWLEAGVPDGATWEGGGGGSSGGGSGGGSGSSGTGM